jgi:GNAT superfamily N-acetyltransferase
MRPYRKSDFEKVMRLWNQTLAGAWPIEQQELALVIHSKSWKRRNDHWVMEKRGRLIAFLATQQGRGYFADRASLLCVITDSEFRRQGAATTLINQWVEKSKKRGIRQISLGKGIAGEFWDGLPENLDSVKPFFEGLGFNFREPTVVYVRKCEPIDRVSLLPIKVQYPSPIFLGRTLRFQWQHFRQWMTAMLRFLFSRGPTSIGIARFQGQLVGTVLFFVCPRGTAGRRWASLVGPKPGIFSAVGVHPEFRGRGISELLIRFAVRGLCDRGAETVYLHRVVPAVAHIATTKLGFTEWRRFWKAEMICGS